MVAALFTVAIEKRARSDAAYRLTAARSACSSDVCFVGSHGAYTRRYELTEAAATRGVAAVPTSPDA